MDNELSTEYDELERIYEGIVEPGNLSLQLLKHMTAHFSPDRKIAAGGFGDVYMGFFRNRSVAVKKITTSAHTLDEQPFRREVMSLMKVKHQNVVQFLGFCSHTVGDYIKQEGSEERVFVQMRERLLCFKYASGSLEEHINDELKGLEWDQRYKIIQGICEGLQHIHMEVKIIHMDLKPANILIDDHMIPKITDFGLAREHTKTHTTGHRFGSRGYLALEYHQHGKMSQKCDIYSLGVIIIQLVTGLLRIPDKDTVLRRWSHRWNKTKKYTLLRRQQVTKCMEIAVRCMKEDPKDRPFIWDIIHDLCENESTNDANESTIEMISPNYEDDMLLIEPLQLHFPFEINKQISHSLQLTNNTDTNIAFNIETPQHFWVQPDKGIVPQRFNCSVTVTLQPQEKALQCRMSDDEFTVESTKVKEGHLRPENITKEMFNKEGVDKVDLSIVYESKINSSTSNELIKVDPELHFPFLPKMSTTCLMKLVNITHHYVGFNIFGVQRNIAKYHSNPNVGILPPWSTQQIVVSRITREGAVEEIQCKDKYFVWRNVVDKSLNASDLHKCYSREYCTKIPVVLDEVLISSSSTSNKLIKVDPPKRSSGVHCRYDVQCKDNLSVWRSIVDTSVKASDLSGKCSSKTYSPIIPLLLDKMPISSSSTSKELIKVEPLELRFPFLPCTSVACSVKLVNITAHYVGYNIWTPEENSTTHYAAPSAGILPPGSTKQIVVARRVKEGAHCRYDVQCKDKLFVWRSIVDTSVKASDLSGKCSSKKHSMEIPLLLDKMPISSFASNEPIQLDPPELRFSFLPNISVTRCVELVNISPYHVIFNVWYFTTNVALYTINPNVGKLAPGSRQKLVVSRREKEGIVQDIHCKDNLFVWRNIVNENFNTSINLSRCHGIECSIKLPIVLGDGGAAFYVHGSRWRPNLVERNPTTWEKPFSSGTLILSGHHYADWSCLHYLLGDWLVSSCNWRSTNKKSYFFRADVIITKIYN